MCMQCGCPMPFMPGMPVIPPFNSPMPMGPMSAQPMSPTSANALMPPPEEIQTFHLRFQLQQLQYMQQNLEQSLEFIKKTTSEVEAAIKKVEKTKPKKGA